jgi:outer membrane protein TolC
MEIMLRLFFIVTTLVFLFSIANVQAQPKTLSLESVLKSMQLQQKYSMKQMELESNQNTLEQQIADKEDDLKLSFRNQLGLRIKPLEQGPAAQEQEKIILLPRQDELYQTHSIVVSKPLHDFGRKEARLRILEVEEKLTPLENAKLAESLQWKGAQLFLAFQDAAGVVKALEAQRINALKKRETQQSEYRKGLRSEADKVRSEADVLRVQMLLERANETLRQKAIQLSAEMNSESEVVMAQKQRVSLPARTAIDWKNLYAHALQVKKDAGSLNTSGTNLAPLTLVELRKLEVEREILKAGLTVVEKSQTPLLLGEVGTQWPGELLPMRGSFFAQITFSWDLPWNGKDVLQKEEILTRIRISESKSEQRIADSQKELRASLPALQELIFQLEISENQRLTLERLKELTRKRYASGRATALELSTIEDELLSNATETVRLQGRIAAALLAYAQTRGDFSFAKKLLEG